VTAWIVIMAAAWIVGAPSESRSAPDAGSPTLSAGSDSIYYQADRVVDDRHADTITFTGNVVIRYKEIQLEAAQITLDRGRQTLDASGLPDSVGHITGSPVFLREGERMQGSRMTYNLNTDRGTVRQGRAAYQNKHLQGEHLMLDPARNLHARSLSLSTCDHPHPHYDFLCSSLKIIENDKAVGRSVTFRIGPVPVFWLPFFVFPMEEKNRRSGILTPSIGSNSRDGIFARNLGYYYAPNDYWDGTARATARERGGFLLETDIRYAIRSKLSGSAEVAFENDTRTPGSTRRNWRLNATHQQRLSPTMGMRGSGQFTSSSTFDQVNSDDAYSYFNRQLRSSFSVDKQWRESGRSVDANLSYFNDLTTDRNRFQGFPRVSFRQGRRPLIGSRSAGRAERKWYQTIFYDVTGSVDNQFTRGPADGDDSRDLSMQGRLGVNSQQRLFGWLDLTPSGSVTQLLSDNDLDQPTRRETYSASLSTGTTLYGIFHPTLGRLRGVRHRFQPRLSFRYNQSATVAGGNFGFGGTRTAGNARRSLGMGLTNAIEIKTEVDGKENRSTFATANITTGYDFDADTRNWESLRTVVSVKPDRRFDVRLNMTHRLENDLGKLDLKGLDLQNLSITSTVRIVGSRGRDLSDAPWDSLRTTTRPEYGFEQDLYMDTEDVTQPWRFSLSHFYETRDLGASNDSRSWLKADLGFNPTSSWRINYGLNLDIMKKDLTAQSLSIYRSLHCWEASFSWYPNGFNRGFSFRINIKDIPQIGVSHRGGGFGL